jgi:hypothetical protein
MLRLEQIPSRRLARCAYMRCDASPVTPPARARRNAPAAFPCFVSRNYVRSAYPRPRARPPAEKITRGIGASARARVRGRAGKMRRVDWYGGPPRQSFHFCSPVISAVIFFGVVAIACELLRELPKNKGTHGQLKGRKSSGDTAKVRSILHPFRSTFLSACQRPLGSLDVHPLCGSPVCFSCCSISSPILRCASRIFACA